MREADELFENTIDSLEAMIERKQAAADVERYNTLYYVYKRDEVLREDLPSDDIEPLLNANLLARVPFPDTLRSSKDKIRITTLGEHEIESDLQFMEGPE